jgi:hypothetical protein
MHPVLIAHKLQIVMRSHLQKAFLKHEFTFTLLVPIPLVLSVPDSCDMNIRGLISSGQVKVDLSNTACMEKRNNTGPSLEPCLTSIVLLSTVISASSLSPGNAMLILASDGMPSDGVYGKQRFSRDRIKSFHQVNEQCIRLKIMLLSFPQC